jgi:hypothetical protein
MHVPVTDRHLFLISRDQPGLWEYLRREFSGEENVEVVLDRRLGRDRRSGHDRRAIPRLVGSTVSDRRIAEQRTRAPVDAQLRTLGYAMLRSRSLARA